MDEDQNNETLTSVYANSTLIELRVWDLKLIFGQMFKNETGKFDVDWHTEVTMPWPQVKLFSYYLQANLAVHEAQNGPIKLPQNLHPVPFVSQEDSTPEDKALNEKIERLRKEFVEGMK